MSADLHSEFGKLWTKASVRSNLNESLFSWNSVFIRTRWNSQTCRRFSIRTLFIFWSSLFANSRAASYLIYPKFTDRVAIITLVVNCEQDGVLLAAVAIAKWSRKRWYRWGIWLLGTLPGMWCSQGDLPSNKATAVCCREILCTQMHANWIFRSPAFLYFLKNTGSLTGTGKTDVSWISFHQPPTVCESRFARLPGGLGISVKDSDWVPSVGMN